MKKLNSILLAFILAVVTATSLYIVTGHTRGKSAYEIAVENGYTGSQNQWLLDLKGKDGQDGESVDYNAMYQQAQTSGYTGTFLDFINDYLAETDDNKLYTIQSAIRSSVSVVTIYSTDTFFSSSSSLSSLAGCGFVYQISTTGAETKLFVITNYHVTYVASSYLASREIYVLLPEDSYILNQTNNTKQVVRNQCLRATYIGGDKDHDLAVLEVSSVAYENASRKNLAELCSTNNIIAATLADPTVDLNIGETCFTIGNPLAEGLSVSDGIVSVAYEQIQFEDVTNTSSSITMRAVRVSININGGNSGGALYNYKGQVIGVINSRRDRNTDGSDVDGISAAIPLPMAVNVISQIMYQCDGTTIVEPTYYKLGITYKINDCQTRYDQTTGLVTTKESIIIEEIAAGSRSEGKLQKDDILKSYSLTYTRGTETNTISGELNHYYSLADLVLKLNIGDSLTLTYDRSGTEGSTTITIE